MTQYKFVKINLKTYKKLRRAFKGKRNESAASYFDRLASYLQKCELCGVHTFDDDYKLDDVIVCEECYEHAVFKSK